jgi:hypothetical protein
MLLAACAIVFELCLAVVLWRLSKQRPSIASNFASFFIGLAAACCLGLATQGFFLLADSVLELSELGPTLFWLTSGLLAVAVALALKPSPMLAAIPFLLIAWPALTLSILYREPIIGFVAAVTFFTAILAGGCAHARFVRAHAQRG